jgi:predicted flap endonuclease-1-like 5' DNA nuclease
MKLSILSNLFTECLWWLLLWMFLAFLLGWILRKYLGETDTDDACCRELDEWKKKYHALELKKEKLNAVKENVESIPLASNLSKTARPQANAYAKLKNNNLQIIEGIGPKMDEVLKKHNVTTWADIASKTAKDLRVLLDKENPKRYKIIDPTTWSDQAQLAVDAKWAELIDMQKDLDTGRTNTIGGTDSKLEKIMIKLGLLKKWKQDDLKAVEGIGPKIAGLLKGAGIMTWNDLANASLEKLKDVLAKAGPRYKLADPGTWAKQAQLADEGKWDELQEYQDFLDGGR